MNDMIRELRHALRTLRRSPLYASIAVLTLALGIGASTAIYTLLERVVLDPLPYPAADRLVRLKSAVPGVGEGTEWQLATAEYFHFAQAGTLEEIGAWRRAEANVATPDGPQRATLGLVTASTLRLIGARAVVGRILTAEDDRAGATPVVVLSHGFWQRRFGGDDSVLGSTVLVDERPLTVIGVMAAGVDLPGEPGSGGLIPARDLWLPLQLDPTGPFQNSHVYPMIARLAADATLERAQLELDRLTARLPEAYPQVYSSAFMEQYGFRTVAYALKPYVVGDLARSLWMLLGAVGLILVIACANVANLFLVRIEGRRRELAVRAALGAGRAAIARQFLAEGLVLAGSGGVLAVVLGAWALDAMLALAPPTMPVIAGAVDGSVVLFALAVTLLVGVALTAFPLMHHGRPQAAALAEGGRSVTVGRQRQRIRGTLVATQVALALVLVVGAGLLLESFRRLRAVEPGVDVEGVVTMQVSLPPARYGDNAAMWRFYDDVLVRVRALPGVTAAGFTGDLPFGGGYGCWIQGFEDARAQRIDDTNCAGLEPTTPGYFEAMGIPLLAGRVFTDADNDNPANAAVVVSRAFAERFWPGEDPIGKGVRPGGSSEPPFYRVIGVVGDIHASTLDGPPAIAIYYPIVTIPGTGGWWPNSLNLVVKANGGTDGLLPAIRAAVADVDPSIPVANVYAMDELLDWSMSRLSFTMLLLAIAAGVALMLAAIGLYGVVSYLVSRRTNEIGVRIAIGADPRSVERLVVGGSLRMTIAGLAIGIIAALASTRVLQGMLFGVEATHPVTYAISAFVLILVAMAASWIPARRAARVDPLTALRSE